MTGGHRLRDIAHMAWSDGSEHHCSSTLLSGQHGNLHGHGVRVRAEVSDADAGPKGQAEVSLLEVSDAG